MKQQLILVTGGNSGIGRGCVEHFIKEGHLVINLDRQHSQAESLSPNEIQVAIDLKNVNDITEAIEEVIAEHGVPTVLINCAGISRMDFTIESKLKDWEDTFKINVFAVSELMKVVAKALIKQQLPGRIINIASQAGKNGYRGLSSYVASKHAVIGLTKTAAIELAKNDILVNAVCPGIVETPMKYRERIEGGALRGMTAEEVYAEDCSQVPLGRTAEVADVVGVIEFLTRGESSYMTGQAINVTGGMTMH
ncbi:SDR family NAD(P)-dependent oxidoreductase [Fundicoccus sp. Sow4_D5]|uniref:SDR family NAD(P)-dependent oxidoreductase n=1 Tax=unclassified Fundicoccus TaxID=2761543 RepID=UPI003F8EED60